MAGGERWRAVASGAWWRAAEAWLEASKRWRVGAMVGRRPWSWRDDGRPGLGCLLFVKKNGFTLPVAESSVEPTKLRHDFESIPVDPCDRQITATDCDRQITVTVIVCLSVYGQQREALVEDPIPTAHATATDGTQMVPH